jgi:hypothetical protein
MSLGRAQLLSLVGSLGLAIAVAACSDSAMGPKEPDLPASGRLGVTPKSDTLFVTDSFATSLLLTPTVNINGSQVATPQAPTSVKWSSRDTAVGGGERLGAGHPARRRDGSDRRGGRRAGRRRADLRCAGPLPDRRRADRPLGVVGIRSA